MEKISKRVNAIEEVNNNVKLLTEMVMSHSQGAASSSSEDLMKELYQRCERMRPTLFRLASDTEDNDEALGEPQAMPSPVLPPPLPGPAKHLQLEGTIMRAPPFSSTDLRRPQRADCS